MRHRRGTGIPKTPRYLQGHRDTCIGTGSAQADRAVLFISAEYFLLSNGLILLYLIAHNSLFLSGLPAISTILSFFTRTVCECTESVPSHWQPNRPLLRPPASSWSETSSRFQWLPVFLSGSQSHLSGSQSHLSGSQSRPFPVSSSLSSSRSLVVPSDFVP